MRREAGNYMKHMADTPHVVCGGGGASSSCPAVPVVRRSVAKMMMILVLAASLCCGICTGEKSIQIDDRNLRPPPTTKTAAAAAMQRPGQRDGASNNVNNVAVDQADASRENTASYRRKTDGAARRRLSSARGGGVAGEVHEENPGAGKEDAGVVESPLGESSMEETPLGLSRGHDTRGRVDGAAAEVDDRRRAGSAPTVGRGGSVQAHDVRRMGEGEEGGAGGGEQGGPEGGEENEEEEEVEEHEEDKGFEEGRADGFVVVARDSSEDEEGGAEDSADMAASNGISKNIMVIVFCALAFGANGGFLVYVFWVM